MEKNCFQIFISFTFDVRGLEVAMPTPACETFRRPAPSAMINEVPAAARAPREIPNLSITRQFNEAAVTGLVNPQPSTVRGIRTISEPLAGPIPKTAVHQPSPATVQDQQHNGHLNGNQRSPGGWKNDGPPRNQNGGSPKSCFNVRRFF